MEQSSFSSNTSDEWSDGDKKFHAHVWHKDASCVCAAAAAEICDVPLRNRRPMPYCSCQPDAEIGRAHV